MNRLITDPFLRTSLQTGYNRVKAYLTNPRVFSDAVMGNNWMETGGSGTPVTDSANVVKRLLEANPEYVVYVDIGATWCVPSMKEVPYAKKLHTELSGKPVSLCICGWTANTNRRGKK